MLFGRTSFDEQLSIIKLSQVQISLNGKNGMDKDCGFISGNIRISNIDFIFSFLFYATRTLN